MNKRFGTRTNSLDFITIATGYILYFEHLGKKK